MTNSCNQDETGSPPLKRIIRPASANSHHYITNSNTAMGSNRKSFLSTEDLIVDLKDTAGSMDELCPFSSLPLHSHSGKLIIITVSSRK